MNRIFKLTTTTALILFTVSVINVKPASAIAKAIYIKPAQGKTILRFGVGYIDAAGRNRRHHGIDISAAEGAAVYAAAPGKVVFAGNTPNGLCVSLVHDDAVKTTYLPLASIRVYEGQVIQAGWIIGYVGPPFDPSGKTPHLHMGAIFAGDYIDPESLFRGEFSPDLSKLIRRGDIPPIEREENFMSPATVAAIEFPGLLGWIWGKTSAFFNWLTKGSRWLGSIITSSASYLWRKIGGWTGDLYARFRNLFISKSFGSWIGGIIPDSGLGRGFGLDCGALVFDPSGDASDEGNRVAIELEVLPANVEIFNDAGDSVWAINAWEISDCEFNWTGVDNKGRIVPNGLYTIIIEYPESVEGFVVEARWHL